MMGRSHVLGDLAVALLGSLLFSTLAVHFAEATSTFMYGTLGWKPVESTATKVRES